MGYFGPDLILLAFALGPLCGGGTQTDLVAVIDPADYFAARRIDAGADNLLRLASANPSDARGSFRQLLAIRRLSENKDPSEAVRRTLARLADGPDGFARDHARTALARIDGRPEPIPHTAPRDSLREGLDWFPQDVSMVGVLDARPLPGEHVVTADSDLSRQVRRVRALVGKTVSEGVREELYRLAETVGDIRLDRLAVGFVPNASVSAKGRLFMRWTGRMNHALLAAYFHEQLGFEVVAERKGVRGEPITILSHEDQPPAIALVGDHDVILAGYLASPINCVGLAEEMLAVRQGSRPGLRSGPLGKSLGDIPSNARGLGRALVPRKATADLVRSALGVAPLLVEVDLLSLSRDSGERGEGESGAGSDLRVRGTFESGAEARTFADVLRGELKEAAAALKDVPVLLQLGGMATIRKAVEEIEVRVEGTAVTVRVPVSVATLRAALGLLEGAYAFRPGGGPRG